MTEYASLTAVRDKARVSSATARRALDDAGIAPNAKGRFPLDLALAAIDAQRSPDKALGRQAAAIINPATTTAAGGAAKPVSDLATARAESERQRARKLSLENARLERDLISKDDVREAGRHFASGVKQALLSFGNQVAPSLVGRSAADIAAEVNRLMRETLTALGDPAEFVINRILA